MAPKNYARHFNTVPYFKSFTSPIPGCNSLPVTIKMEIVRNADTLHSSKENIHPVKRGLNAGRLSLEVLAQSDANLRKILQKRE